MFISHRIETLRAAWNLSALSWEYFPVTSQVQPASRNEKIKTAVKEAADRCWTSHTAMLLSVEPSFHNLTITLEHEAGGNSQEQARSRFHSYLHCDYVNVALFHMQFVIVSYARLS